MKHVLLALLLFPLVLTGYAQSVGIGTATPDASAKVDIQSTNSGILIPRMTTAQRTAIATPATGLLVFDNTTSSFWYYDGSTWIELISDSSLELVDADEDTKVQVEESPDEDIIRFDLAGTEHFVMDGPHLEVFNSGESVFIGEGAGANDDLSPSNRNTFIGYVAGQQNTTGTYNTFVGNAAGQNNVTGFFNTFLGDRSGVSHTAGDFNTFVGTRSGQFNDVGQYNTFIGATAGSNNTTGNYNTAVGKFTGTANTIGTENTFIGSGANATSNNLTNATALGANTTVSASNSMVLGNNVNVGIGISAPQTKLHIEDSGPTIIRISSTTSSEGVQFLSPGAGSGALTDWSLISGGSSLQLGYSYDDFAGSLVHAYFYDNGDARIGATGLVGIGIYPQEKLHVDGGIRIGNTSTTAAGNIRWTGSDYEGYDGTAWRSFTADQTILEDADGDTKVQVEESPDEDIIRFDLAGTEHFVMDGPRLEVMNSGNSVFIGTGAGANDDLSANQNVFIGTSSGAANTTGNANNFLGFESGTSNTAGWANTFLGFYSGQTNSTGHDNTFIGASAGRFNTIGESNAFVGNGAGYNNVDGNFNTFMGRDVGLANTTGNNNTFIGYRSGFNNTASNNLFMGYQAGYNNTSGDANSFLGIESGWSTTTGSANTFLGFYSGQDNTTGHDNTFIGASAGRFNTTGHSNAFVGNGAGVDNMDGNYNTAMGRTAGHDNTTGNNNTSIGYGAGYKNTVSNNNFFGYRAGYNTTTGVSNTFLGNVSGHANTTGHDNAFVGSASGMNNTTGHSNVFLGPGAGYQNQTGNFSVYIGRDAGLNGTTGTGNVFIGYQAGMNEAGNDKLYIDNSNTTSPLIYGDFNSDIAAINGNLGVGDITPAGTLTVGNGDKFQVDGTNGDVLFTDDQASITFPAATASAAPMIQLFASGTTNPTRMVLAHSSTWSNYGLQYQDAGDKFHFISGGTEVMTIDLASTTQRVGIRKTNPGYDLELGFNSAAKPTSNTWTVPSDARLKKDVHGFEDGLAEILKIRPVTYTYTGEAGLPQETGVGIIAQELKEVAPYMVSTWTYEGEEADLQEYYAVDNGAMTYMLINAIQEQQKLIEQLQQQVKELRSDR